MQENFPQYMRTQFSQIVNESTDSSPFSGYVTDLSESRKELLLLNFTVVFKDLTDT